jgi:hypothetical protein
MLVCSAQKEGVLSIIIQNMATQASMNITGGVLGICFDDPAYIRSEQVIVDRGNRAVGVVFEQGFHHIGCLPAGIDLAALHIADLSGQTHGLHLQAPIKVSM